MKKFLTTLVIASVCGIGFAQKLEIGLMGGYQSTNSYAVVADKIADFNPTIGSGFAIGGYLSWAFYKKLHLNVNALYGLRSTNFNIKYKSDTTTILKRAVFSISLPIHLRYKFDLNKEMSISPLIGGSINVNLHGKDIAYQNTDLQRPIDLQGKQDYIGKHGRIRPLEASADAGIMFRYKEFGVQMLYSFGFTNLTVKDFDWCVYLPNNHNKYLFNRNLQVSFIYAFRIK